jgi:DNA polymerase III delta subunit
MLSLYFGNDLVSARTAALGAVDSVTEKVGARLTKIESAQFASGMIADMLGATSLFGGIEVYLIDTPSEESDFYSEVTGVLAEMSQSNNQFVIIEGTLLAPEKKKFEKFAQVMTEFKKPAEAPFNVWALADALASRDKKSLWVLLQDAKRAGLVAEEIIGTLWWQLKSMRLAQLTRTASEAGMKDFPYNKAKRALSKFKEGEVEALSRSLLKLYHDGHGGVRDIDEGLEEWVLRG